MPKQYKNQSPREKIFRDAVQQANGTEQEVLSDLYRHLVIAHYTPYTHHDGYRFEGQKAIPYLDRVYPNHGHLDRFRRSGDLNIVALLIANLARFRKMDPGFQQLEQILLRRFDTLLDPIIQDAFKRGRSDLVSIQFERIVNDDPKLTPFELSETLNDLVAAGMPIAHLIDREPVS